MSLLCTTKPTKWPVWPVKTQISLGIHPVWSESSLSACRNWDLSYPLSALRRLIRLGGWPGWSESSLGAHVLLLVLSCFGSYLWSLYIEMLVNLSYRNMELHYFYDIKHWCMYAGFCEPMHTTKAIKPHAPSKHRLSWASAQSDQSSLSTWRSFGSLTTHRLPSRLLSHHRSRGRGWV